MGRLATRRRRQGQVSPSPDPRAPVPANDPGGPEDVTHIDVKPEEVLQPDRRPWARLSLDQVVVRTLLISTVAVALTLGVIALVTKLAGIW